MDEKNKEVVGYRRRLPSNSTLLDCSKALPVHKVWQQNISPISKGLIKIIITD